MAAGRGDIERLVGSRIRGLREAQLLTQAALARLARTSQSNLARIENGDRSATLGSLAKIAKALDVGLTELFGPAPKARRAAKAEKMWFRLCDRLRDRDEHFLRGVELLLRAFESAAGRVQKRPT